MAYYDPKTYAAVDPTKVSQSISGYDEGNNPQYSYSFNGTPVNQVSGTGVNGWGDWLAGEGAGGGARSYTKLQQYMGDLSKNYGLGAQDFIKGFQSYGAQYNPGETDEWGNVHGFGRDPNMGWWGEDAMIRALGQGLDSANPNAAYKGSWNNLWNQQNELKQQGDIAATWEKGRAAFEDAADFGNDLPTILKGLAIVASAGAASGAFAGAGAAGAGGAAGSGGIYAANGLGAAAPAWSAAVPGASGWAAATPAMFGGAAGGLAAGTAANAFPTGGADWMSEIAAGAGNGGTSLGNLAGTTANAGGNMFDVGGTDWMDEIAAGAGNGGTTGGVSIPDGLNFDMPPSGENTLTPTSGGVKQQLLQKMVDSGIPFDAASSAVTGMSPTQLINAAKMLGVNGGAAAGTGTALSRIMSGNGTMSDYLSAGGVGLGGVLDAYGQMQNTQALKDIDSRNWGAGAPSRGRYESAMTNGFNDAGFQKIIQPAMDQATQTYLRQLSAQNGNPAGIGAAPSQTQAYVLGNVGLPAFQNYVNQNANAGGIGSLSGATPQTGTNAANASGNIYGSIGKTAAALTNPNQGISLSQLFNSNYLA